jgi:5-dehydro-2-deoxygluconokinase
MALEIDHRKQRADLCRAGGADVQGLEQVKLLGIAADARVAAGETCFGVLGASHVGRAARCRAEELGLWVARPVEKPGSIPVRFEPGEDLGAHLVEWPVSHTVKCLAFYHPDDPAETRQAQDRALLQLQEAALMIGREFLVEIIAGASGPVSDDTISGVMDHLYGLGILPDWWKLEPLTSAAAWRAVDQVIAKHDPDCRGIVILGKESDQSALEAAFRASSASTYVNGFAVGRTIFMNAAEQWLKGEIDDEAAIEEMAQRFRSLVDLWRSRRGNG